MQILSLYYTHKPGGMCKRLYRLLNALTERGHEVHYLCLDTPPETLSKQVKVHQIPFCFSARRGLLFWALFTLWCPLYTAWMARSIKPERYVVFGAYYSSMLSIARMLHAAPSVLFLRSLVFKINRITKKPGPVAFIADIVDRAGTLASTSVVCMTAAMKQELEQFLRKPLKNVEILLNDLPSIEVPTRESARARLSELLHEEFPEGSFLFLTSGVLDQRKNVSLLLNTLSKLANQSDQNYLLLIAGTGPLEPVLRSEAKQLDLNRVRFIGWREDIEQIYPACDLIIHPSVHEGVPNSVLEPLAIDLPVLTSDIPELREIMKFDQLLFPDDAEQLSQLLLQFMNDDQFRNEIARKCRERAELLRFDWETKASEICTR